MSGISTVRNINSHDNFSHFPEQDEEYDFRTLYEEDYGSLENNDYSDYNNTEYEHSEKEQQDFREAKSSQPKT